MKVNEPSEPWPCDWEGAELAQLRRDASRSFRQNLMWLEEMTDMVDYMQAARAKQLGLPPPKRFHPL